MIIFCLRCPVFDRLGKMIGKRITGLFREKKKEKKKKEKKKEKKISGQDSHCRKEQIT